MKEGGEEEEVRVQAEGEGEEEAVARDWPVRVCSQPDAC